MSDIGGVKSNQTPTGFGLYELLTLVVPGAFLFIVLLLNSGALTRIPLPVESNTFLLVFATISVIFGVGIDSFRKSFMLVPRHIRKICYDEMDEKRFLGVVGAVKQKIPYLPDNGPIHPKKSGEFYDIFKGRYLAEYPYDLKQAYKLLLTDIESDLSDQAYRDKMTMEFCLNMVISSIAGVLFSTSAFVFGDVSDIWSSISLILSIPILFLFVQFIRSQERRWTNALIRELVLSSDILAEEKYGKEVTDDNVTKSERKIEE